MIPELTALIALVSVAQAPPVRNDTIHLNITERRIDSGPYETSLQVGLDQPLTLRVGVAVEAGHLTTILRGVRGDGRFHGDLSALDRVITSHRTRVQENR